jgi:hypothetical protein
MYPSKPTRYVSFPFPFACQIPVPQTHPRMFFGCLPGWRGPSTAACVAGASPVLTTIVRGSISVWGSRTTDTLSASSR